MNRINFLAVGLIALVGYFVFLENKDSKLIRRVLDPFSPAPQNQIPVAQPIMTDYV